MSAVTRVLGLCAKRFALHSLSRCNLLKQCVLGGRTRLFSTTPPTHPYLQNSYLFSHTSSVKKVETAKIKNNQTVHWVQLQETIFHPQGGGQPSDQGTINGIRVDLVAKNNLPGKHQFNVNHGFFSNPQFAIDQKVKLEVDPEVRKLNMRLHSAGHLIAHIVEKYFPQIQAVKAHHFPKEGRVIFETNDNPDVKKIQLTIEQEIKKLLASKTSAEIIHNPSGERQLKIGDFPPIGCGGTHVKELNELGVVVLKDVKLDKKKLHVLYDISTNHLKEQESIQTSSVSPLNNPLVSISDSISPADILKLMSGEILAISIPKYFPENLCKQIVDGMLAREKYGYYNYADNVVGHYGMSLSEIGQKEERLDEYFDTAVPTIRKIRKWFKPYLSPIDKLRLELDEIWPLGASLARMYGDRAMLSGLCRIIEPNKLVLPHQDMLHWDIPSNDFAKTFLGQMAVNVYLNVPKSGGELELWDYGIVNLEEYTKNAEGTYGISKTKLPPPRVTLKPKLGEMIIFNPRKLHCILPGSEQRLTMSTFIGYRGNDKPLIFWN